MASLNPLELLLAVILFVCLLKCNSAQFPAVCNTPENLQNKVCCPNNCNQDRSRGDCVDVTSKAEGQSDDSEQEIVDVLRNAPTTDKGTIDSRFLWPTMVFQNVCICSGNFYGVDCNECAFGWSGENCATKTRIVRRSFGSLLDSEKETLRAVCPC